MKTILTAVIALIGKNLSKVICSLCDVAKAFFQYKSNDAQNKIEERNQKKEEEYEKKVDDVTKNGDIEDLLNLKR